ncbi:helix-turn-helix transcriptional regulator [Microbacterium deminutum]|uniref:Helix-turn-helix transcriptional regulator n=1 Tax=Microbacterium deminutum TaxID=344164 RepID=A0ABN2Q5B9_9MICO
MRAVVSPSLVGRQDDLEALHDAYADSAAGSSRAVLVGGEAGIGKTRLVDEFLRTLPEDAIVLRGQSIDLDRDAPPYAPILSVLRSLAQEVGEQALFAASGPAGDALALLLPDLSLSASMTEAPVRGSAERLYDAVAEVLENVAAVRPVVLVIEDLHWVDQASLGLLRFLVRVIEHSRLLIVLTFRSDELGRGSALRAWLPELDRNRRVTRLELARLDRRQVREMATAILDGPPDEEELAQVYLRTDGVPFFVEELVCCSGVQSLDGFPETLRDILLARYDQLADATQRMLRLIAAGGVRVEHELLVAVCDESPDAIDAAASEAIAGNVLVVDDTAYAFRHALVREAIHDQLLPGERVRFHTRYAQALLEHTGAGAADGTAVSYHWMAAHNVREAFIASVAAFQQARASFAYAAAANMGERAIELWDQVADAEELAGRTKVQLLHDTSYVLRNAGESERAIALIDDAIALCEPDDVQVYALLLRNKASYLANIGQTGSIELLREALVVLDGEPRSVLRANVLGELAARLMLLARFEEAMEMADGAFAEATAVDNKPRMSVASNIRGFSRLAGGDIEAGLADLALAGELAIGNDSARLRYWVNMSDALHLVGRYEEAVRTAEEGAERARQRGVERTSGAVLLSNVISPLYALGQTARADEMLDRALELDSPIGFSAPLRRMKVQAVLWSGDRTQAERLLRDWRGPLRQQQRMDAQLVLSLALVSGELALARGETAEAWREVAVLLDPEHRSFPAYDLPLIALAARVLGAARVTGTALPGAGGDATSADELERDVRSAQAVAQRWPTAPAYSAIVDAELGGPRGTGTDPALWERAVEAVHDPIAPARLAPYTAFRLAEALANAGDRAGARTWAQASREWAEAIGLGLIVDSVTELERRVGAVGGEHRGDAPVDAASIDNLLTERERQVLDLIAHGLSNRAIAEELFISTKTASVHVSNILRKTGATTRTEAAYLAHNAAR